MVTSDSPSIAHGQFEHFLWLRCLTRGSFLNSPVIKSFADQYIDAGGRIIVIDLEICPGIDSTFMGTLAGITSRLRPLDGALHIASATDRCLNALESLGLDALLAIEPPDAPWRGRVMEIRQHLKPAPHEFPSLDSLSQTKHVLESHEILSDLSEENAAKFQHVTECLKHELDQKGE